MSKTSPTANEVEAFPDPKLGSAQYTGDASRHRDADSIRRYFGFPAWDRERHDDHPMVIPNCIDHTMEPGPREVGGGTDLLCRGKPGSGKSTFARYIATRLMEVNSEKVVWRGSTVRSEWLPLAPWTRVCLPRGVTVTARLDPKDPTKESIYLDIDHLGQIVREIVRYDDPVQLNRDLLKPGQFHVVYPDPKMRGCQAVYEEAGEKTYEPPRGRELFSPEDPANHWWFAWFLARVEHGPHHWTTWICDEIGDIMPQSAQKDSFGTYQKVELAKDTWVDARKHHLTVYAFGHSEKDIHQMIRHKIRWRVQMPGQANPTSASKVVGFDAVPMDFDITSSMPLGEALMYTETNFDRFRFADLSGGPDYNLKLQLGGAA